VTSNYRLDFGIPGQTTVMNGQELVILPDAYRERSAVFVLLVTALLGILFWQNGVTGSSAVAAFSLTAVIGLSGSLSFETRISEAEQRVVRLWRLGGFLPVWKRTYPFTSLRGVQQFCFADADKDVWRVGLVTASGKFLMVTYFSSRILKEAHSEAERFQDYLARILCVPVLERSNC
jgi:hypothetical protein